MWIPERIMKKKLSKLITISAGLFIITSCATTKVSESSDTTTIEVTENKQTEKVRKEPKQIRRFQCGYLVNMIMKRIK